MDRRVPGRDFNPASVESRPARETWNRRYREKDWRPFPDAPAPWLSENRSLVIGAPGRRALDVACGDGRNAVYLARCGFDVDAVDISDVAIDALQAAATARGLPINPYRQDLERDVLPVAQYDVIVQINYLQRDLFAALGQALTPGGILVFETVTRAHVEALGNRFDARFLLNHNELAGAFPGLCVRRSSEGVVVRSGRSRAVASLVAQRPRETRAGRRAAE
jgi:tellurite methyltransferase